MSEIVNVAEIFGKNVFNETVMKERLPKSVFKKMKKTIEDGAELDPSIAERSNPLYPLVPAADRRNRREA